MGFGNPMLGYWLRLYEHQTTHEVLFEAALAKMGERYRTQHPFIALRYFADFALPDTKVVIEVDGKSHLAPAQREKDLQHTLQVLDRGWVVARVTNDQVSMSPRKAVEAALAEAWGLRELATQNKDGLASLYRAQLDRLHRDHPGLLLKSAKPARKRTPRPKVPSAPKAETRRRTRVTRSLSL